MAKVIVDTDVGTDVGNSWTLALTLMDALTTVAD